MSLVAHRADDSDDSGDERGPAAASAASATSASRIAPPAAPSASPPAKRAGPADLLALLPAPKRKRVEPQRAPEGAGAGPAAGAVRPESAAEPESQVAPSAAEGERVRQGQQPPQPAATAQQPQPQAGLHVAAWASDVEFGPSLGPEEPAAAEYGDAAAAAAAALAVAQPPPHPLPPQQQPAGPALARRFAQELATRGAVELQASQLLQQTVAERAVASVVGKVTERPMVSALVWSASDGSVRVTPGVTKTANRKHQINSLALNALAIEEQLARAQAMGAPRGRKRFV